MTQPVPDIYDYVNDDDEYPTPEIPVTEATENDAKGDTCESESDSSS